MNNTTNENRFEPAASGGAVAVRPELGLVCITSTGAVRFRTITRTRYLKLDPAEQEATLRSIYSDNLQRVDGALTFCNASNIRLYRASSSLFPFSDEPLGIRLMHELQPEFARIGQRAKDLGIRVLLHPDQFVVLSSDTDQVVTNSITILEKHALAFDLFGFPQSSWATHTLHGGKGDRADQLLRVIDRLPDAIRSRLSLENDERAYSAAEILDVCRRAGLPMIFDAHHHACHEKLDSYEHPSVAEMAAAARETWANPDWQVAHISNGRESFTDIRHSDYITAMPSAYRNIPYIEVEAAMKEQAIFHLKATWLDAPQTPAPDTSPQTPLEARS